MILASVITYELAKRIGAVEAEKEFSRQCNAVLDEPNGSGIPTLLSAKTVRKLRRHGEVAKLHDAGGTSIGHARSRAFSVALHAIESGQPLDLWVSIDDDVEASDDTVAHLVGSIDPDSPQIIIVPCRLRQDRPVANVTLDPDNTLERVSKTGAHLRRALYGGFGIVAVTRAAVLEIAHAWRDLTYLDDDGQTRLGVFCEFIRNGYWFREDYAFFSRVPSHVRIEALCSGVTDHAGYKLRLDNFYDSIECIPVPPGYSRRDTEPPPDAGDWHGERCPKCGSVMAVLHGQGAFCVAPGCLPPQRDALTPEERGSERDFWGPPDEFGVQSPKKN